MGGLLMPNEPITVADQIAHFLDKRDADVNELSECVGFLRDLAQSKKRGTLFFDYLDTIIAEGRAVVRSGRTLDYYRAIRDACRRYLQPYQDNPQRMAWILGWAARLMRYYAVEDRLGHVVRRPRRSPTHPSAAGERRTGTVKWFSKSKGYGFIEPDDGSDDVFVHRTAIPEGKGIEERQHVEFATEKTPKGLRARDVRPL
jgi:cold shock CspA family protein